MSLPLNLQSQTKNKVLHFVVQDVRMCIYLNELRKVLPLTKLKKIPQSPNYIAGLMNFNGKTIPIIDLAIRTGLTRHKKYSINVPILLCQHQEKIAGLIVDDVIGLADVETTSLEKSDVLNKSESFFLGTLMTNLETALIVNISYLLGNS